MGDTVSVGWWRRNALALGALVILVPAGVWAFDTIEFGSVRNAQHSVPVGAELLVGDWTFATPEIIPVDPEEVGAPFGSRPVLVQIAVTPGEDAVVCATPALIDPTTGREWGPRFDLDRRSEDGERDLCPRPVDDEGVSAVPFDLTALVLLPADAPGRLLVEFQGYLASDAVATEVRFDVTR